MQGLLPSHVHLQRHPVGAVLVLVRPDAHDGALKALPAAEPVHIPPHHPPVICMTAICMLTFCTLSLAVKFSAPVRLCTAGLRVACNSGCHVRGA